jgi:glycosyltransferase involved in cell wall biosynthesis
MNYVFLSYVNTPAFKRPEDWIKRIRGYFGVLEALSAQHTVISIEQIDHSGEYRAGGVVSYFLNYGPRIQRFPWALHRFVRRLKPDIVVVHGLRFPLQVILLRLALGGRARIVLQAHADKLPAGWRKSLQRWADRSTNAYLFTSRVMGEEWVGKGLIRRDEKIRELMVGSSVLSGIPREAARHKTGVVGNPVFVWAGRLDSNKDPFTLLEAFLGFAERHPEARLYMIYQTEEWLPEIRTLLEKAGTTAVVLAGKVDHVEMGYWFSAADFVISTSRAEAFGLAVVEAMSCGCIPVITSIPSHQKITGGRCGLLFAPGDVPGLQKAMEQAVGLDLEEERRKVSRQFSEQLSFSAIAEQLAQIGDSLITSEIP